MLQINSTLEKTQAGAIAAAFDRVKENAKNAGGNLSDATHGILVGGKKLSNALGQVLPNEHNSGAEEQKTLSFS